MYTYKSFKTSKSAVTILVVALVLVAWASLGYAVKPDKPDKPGGGGGERTALVTISGPDGDPGPMETAEPQMFGLKDNDQMLILNRGVWDTWGAVPIKYYFVNTAGEGSPPCEGDEVLKAHLVDGTPGISPGTFPDRWGVRIEIDTSSLGEFDPDNLNSSTTDYKGGHSIDITTDPPTITGTRERLWIPEGPNKSGQVTVECVSDTPDPATNTRTRVFRFTSFKIQVVNAPSGSEKKNNPRKWMRCDNLDGPIEVTVVTKLASLAAPPASNVRSELTSTWGRIKADRD